MNRLRRRWHWPRITRDTVTFLAGLVVLGHETFATHPSDAGLLTAALLLMGFPVAWRANDSMRRGGDTSKGYYRVLDDEARWEREHRRDR